ncbi:hypothetical protein V8C43DRAFT_310567 [Trichoderma afarasin]
MDIERESRKRDSLKPWNWLRKSRSSSRASSGHRIATSANAPLEPSRASVLSHTSEPPSRQRPSAPRVESQLAEVHLTPPLPTIETQPPPPTSIEAPKPSTPFSDLWARAFTEANDETQKWIKKHGLDSPTGLAQDQIKEVVKLIESNKLSEQNDQPLKIEIGNQKIIVREYITDAVAFITMVGDAAITFAPPQASAPWAVAKAVLKIPVKQIEQKAALLGTVQWFTRIVRRGQIYEATYNTSDEKAIRNLYDALLDVYKTALELLASSDTLFDSRVARQALKAVLKPDDATGKVKDLSKKEQQLSIEVQACEALRSATSSKETYDNLNELKKQLDQLSSPVLRTDKRVATLLEKLEERELDDLKHFISSEMFGKSHVAVTDTRIEHTGDWLLANRDFRAWQEISSSSAVLCLKGTVGTGKTYLTSKVIDYVKQALATSQHDEGFAFFYCNRSGPTMQDPIVVLRSFVRQLASKAFGEPGLIQSSLIQKCKAAAREGRELGYKECKTLILESMNLYSKTTIILDALDESDITTHNLCTILLEMMEESKRPVKIFISTRPDRKYLKAFQNKRIITLDASNQQEDIERFLEEKLYSTESFIERSQEVQEEIRQVFATRSCGMFRWVYLQVRSLENHITDDAVHNWARKLPRNLTEAYDHLWNKLRGYDDFDVDLAERAIMWVLCSIEPLELKVLLEAIRYAVQGSTVIQKKEQTQQQILSLCQDLLTIDEKRGVWMIPHASVAEYFESRGYTIWKCDLFASKVCLGVFESFWPKETDYRDGSFASYVTKHWGKHVGRYDQCLGMMEEAKADPNLTEALERFLGSPGESSANYRKWAGRRVYRREFHPTNLALLAVCRYGLWYVLRDWWLHSKITMEMAFEKNGSTDDKTSLMLAAESNCLPMVKHLVDLIDVKHPHAAKRCVDALNSALAKENFDIVKFLIMEASVDVNLPKGRWGKTAVQEATKFSPATLQWMLDQGIVDVNRENDTNYRYGNVLIAAVCSSQLESVQILLKAGANVNAAVHNGSYGSALVAAATHMSPEIVRLLLEHGADPNLPLKGGGYGSALEASMMEPWIREYIEERKEIQHLLLDTGADPTAVFELGMHGSALAAAAFWGRKEILVVMVDRVGAELAIQTLRRSRHPTYLDRYFDDEEDVQRWKNTATYLGQMGVSKETIHTIGLWEDIELECTSRASRYRGKYLLDYSKINHRDN